MRMGSLANLHTTGIAETDIETLIELAIRSKGSWTQRNTEEGIKVSDGL